MASLGKGEDDVGSKRIRDTEDGFIMCKGGGEGERVEIEDVVATENEKKNINNNRKGGEEEHHRRHNQTDDDDGGDDARPKDPAEALANLFHECLQNLSYLSAVVKM